MEIDIQATLQRYRDNRKIEQPKTERKAIIKMFVDKLNEDRRNSGRKELPAGFYAIKMAQSGIKTTGDLWWFYSYCNEVKNFSSCWWWSLNPKNAKQ